MAAFVSFDGKDPIQIPLSGYLRDGSTNNEVLTAGQVVIKIPEDAREAKVYFRGATEGTSMYDSDFGQNYKFPVVPGSAKA